MRGDENDMLVSVAALDVFTGQNELLLNRLKFMSQEHFVITQRLQEEREALKQKTFDTRMQLDQILRQSIKTQRKVIAKESVCTTYTYGCVGCKFFIRIIYGLLCTLFNSKNDILAVFAHGI
jgi:hypothetical protein